MAKQGDEIAALNERYGAAVASAVQDGLGPLLADFEKACGGSRAVISRPLNEVRRLATSDSELYATFYELQNQRIPRDLPAGPNWDLIRAVADTALFGDENKREIRFGALSLDRNGLPSYGDCALSLRDEMIAHRASAFEKNSLFFMKEHRIPISDSADLPKGFRSTWTDRAKLCTAKLGGKLSETVEAPDFAAILLKEGASSLDDDFVEVHVFGPMTIRTFEFVVVRLNGRDPASAQVGALRETCEKYGVACEVRA